MENNLSMFLKILFVTFTNHFVPFYFWIRFYLFLFPPSIFFHTTPRWKLSSRAFTCLIENPSEKLINKKEKNMKSYFEFLYFNFCCCILSWWQWKYHEHTTENPSDGEWIRPNIGKKDYYFSILLIFISTFVRSIFENHLH